MNDAQRKILKGVLAAISITVLFPPFHSVTQGYTVGLGFGFILSGAAYNGYTGTVDVAFLLAEWVAIGVIASILWALARPEGSTMNSLIATIHTASKQHADTTLEVARIAASSRERVAEIMSKRD
jgi:hypothetical protein